MNTIYDATKDFLVTSQAGSPWTFGYSVDGGANYSLVTFDAATDSGWTMSAYNVAGAPTAWRNLGAAQLYGVSPGQLSLHPGPRPLGDFAILRFTAPQDATYRVTGQFYGGDRGSMNGRVIRDDNMTSPLQIFEVTGDDSILNLTPMHLSAGQTLDFVVGNNGDFSFGNTPISVVVEVLDPTSYDATSQFQSAANPGTNWSYGYSIEGGAGYSLTLFDNNAQNVSSDWPALAWSMSGYNNSGTPAAWRNLGRGTRYGAGPGQVSLHPGPRPNGDYAVLRFMAPTSGTYKVTGQFYAGDSGNMNASVILDGNFDSPLQYFQTTKDDSAFNLTQIVMAAGQTLDFVVGNNGDYSSGTTPVSARIELISRKISTTIAVDGQKTEVSMERNPSSADSIKKEETGDAQVVSEGGWTTTTRTVKLTAQRCYVGLPERNPLSYRTGFP